MTQEEIVKLAREAGFNVGTAPQIERFAALVAKAERDRIADQIDRMPFGDTAASFSIWVRDQGKTWDWPGREQL